MTLRIVVTQERMENIDPSDLMTPTDTIKAINETALDQLIDSSDTNREVKANSETTHAIDTNAHAHQVVLALDVDVHG